MEKEQIQNHIIEKLNDIGHWRVEIRPSKYNEKLVKTIINCFDVIDQSQVSYRGWPYPFFSYNEDERDYDDNWCSIWVNPDKFSPFELEIWKFWKSGQIIHKFAFVEDSGRISEIPNIDKNDYFSVINVLYTLTEIFYFTRNLHNKLKIDDPIVVKITLSNVKNRYLREDEFTKFRHNKCLDNDIEFDEFTLSKIELYQNIDDIIIKMLKEFFEYFDYKPSNMQFYVEEQQKFVKGIR